MAYLAPWQAASCNGATGASTGVHADAAVVDPERVVLGGGIGQAPGFAESVAAELETLVPFVPEVRVSALGHDAVVDGCLVLGLERAWQHFLDRT